MPAFEMTANKTDKTCRYRSFLFLFFIFAVSKNSAGQNFDIKLLRQINCKESGFKNDFFKIESRSVTVMNIAAPCGIFVAGLATHDKKLKVDALFMTGAFVLSAAITQSTKKIIGHARPFESYGDIVKRSEGGGYSFPSGHTSAAFTTATSVSLLFPKWYVIVPSYLWAASVGYARMYQGVHYPSDVLVGAVVGAGSAWLSWKIERLMTAKINKIKIIL